jgi:hypothetical protein
LPPFVIVGMDHAGPMRSYEYTPYKPGTAIGGLVCCSRLQTSSKGISVGRLGRCG